MNMLTLGRTRGGGWGVVDATPHTVFLEFFQDELLSTSTVFSSHRFKPTGYARVRKLFQFPSRNGF